jgi:hypothetical protein
MKVKELIAKLQEFDGELPVQIVQGEDNNIERVAFRSIRVEGGFEHAIQIEGSTPF